MKKAFTLIEVMVATIIVVIASFSLLSLSSNSKHLFNLITKNNDFSLKVSILGIEQKTGNLYDNVLDFNITNDDVIHTLKKYKFNLKKDTKIEELKEFKVTKEIDTLHIYNKTNQIQLYEVKIK